MSRIAVSVAAVCVFLIHFSLKANTLAFFQTYWGTMEVELFDEEKPVTVQNFKRYLESGRYKNTIFHRCPTNPITGYTDFVVQGGGFVFTNDGTGSFFARVDPFPAVTNEFHSGQEHSNVYGTLAMALANGDPNSATSDWFFNLKNNSFLDAPVNGNFTVFGRVLRGTNVLNAYIGRTFDFGLKNLGGALAEVPVKYVGTNPPMFSQFEYVDVSLLKLHCSQTTNGPPRLSWTSIPAKTNVLQFSDTLPPQWENLVPIPGNGTPVTVTDLTATNPFRIYRLQILY